MPIFAIVPIDSGFLAPLNCSYRELLQGDNMATYLKQHGHQYYLRLAIPRPVRQHFPSASGKPRDYVVEPLGRNYDLAKIEAARRIAEYRPLFERAPVMTPEAIQGELEAIKARGKARESVATLPLLESELRRIRGEFDAKLEARRKRLEAIRPDDVWQDMRRSVYREVAEIVAKSGHPYEPDSPEWNVLADKVLGAQGFSRTIRATSAT